MSAVLWGAGALVCVGIGLEALRRLTRQASAAVCANGCLVTCRRCRGDA
jgi:hypothetical protein